MGRSKWGSDRTVAGPARSSALSAAVRAGRSLKAWVLPMPLPGRHPRSGVSLAPGLPGAAVASPAGCGVQPSSDAWVPPNLSGWRSRPGVYLASNLPDAAAASPRGRSIPLCSIESGGAASIVSVSALHLGSPEPSQGVRILPTQAQRRVGGGQAGKKTAPNEVRGGRSPRAHQPDDADGLLAFTRDALDEASVHSSSKASVARPIDEAASPTTGTGDRSEPAVSTYRESSAQVRANKGPQSGRAASPEDAKADGRKPSASTSTPTASSTAHRLERTSGLGRSTDAGGGNSEEGSTCRGSSAQVRANEGPRSGRAAFLESSKPRPVSVSTSDEGASSVSTCRGSSAQVRGRGRRGPRSGRGTSLFLARRGTSPLATLLVAALALVASLAMVVPSTANASDSNTEPQPYWRLTSEAIPTNVAPGKTGMLLLRVENVGDVPSVAGSPVTVVDQLPKGTVATKAAALEATSLAFETQGPLAFWGSPEQAGECTITEDNRTVTCTLQAGDTVAPSSSVPISSNTEGAGFGLLAPPIGIAFVTESGASGTLINDATVKGGGSASSATATSPVHINSPVGFGLSSFHMWSTNIDGIPATQAGAHPYELTTHLAFNNEPIGSGDVSSGVVRDVNVELPPGLVGDPDAAAKCSRADFDIRLSNSFFPDCPADSQIGIAILELEPNDSAEAAIYNLVPPAGVPAQFGIAVSKFVAYLNASVKRATNGEYRVAVDTSDIQSNGLLGVTAMFWGDPASPSHAPLRYFEGRSHSALGAPDEEPGKPFLRLPTSCGVRQSLSVSASSWEGALAPPLIGVESTNEQNEPVEMEGCSKLDFSPSLELSPETSTTGSPTGIEANLKLPQNEDPNGLAEADLKDASVTLPPGWTLSSSAANGLEACSPEQIGLGNEQQPTCPAASKIGTLEVTTPLLEHPLEGEIYVAQQETVDGALLGGYLVVDDARTGVLIKLPGRFEVGGEEGVKGLQPGQIRAVFENSPQFPFSNLKLKFFGGPRAALMTPQGCGSSSATTEFTGWNGALVTPESNAIATNTACAQGFSPSFTAGTSNNSAGQYSPLTLSLSRTDSEQQLSGLSFTLPPGVAAKLAGVPECSNQQANEGSCPESTQIGTVTVGAGAGPEPLYVKGTMYLTGPYKGAPFGEVVEVPAIAGPFNLDVDGHPVVVRGAIRINQATAQGEVVSDPLPTELRGIQIDERSVQVDVNRNNFVLNPTNCGQLATTGSIRSTTGTVANVSSPFKASGCSKLPFKPVMTLSTQSHATKAYGASLSVKLSQKPGEANIHRVELQLPTQLPARLTTLQKACTEQVFAANPASCPKASIIGTAKAVTPVLSKPLKGPAILVSHGGAAFPDVEFVLQGEGVTIVLDGKTDIKKGITYSKFETVPDAPVTTFESTFPTGPNSIFAAYVDHTPSPDLCGYTLAIPTMLEGQNGSVVKVTKSLAVTGCPKAKSAKKPKAAKHNKKARRATVTTSGAWSLAKLPSEIAALVQRGLDSTRRAL
jgi:hypothetical protein